jgi:hypothetical protein
MEDDTHRVFDQLKLLLPPGSYSFLMNRISVILARKLASIHIP